MEAVALSAVEEVRYMAVTRCTNTDASPRARRL
jgi:hypothetical protein